MCVSLVWVFVVAIVGVCLFVCLERHSYIASAGLKLAIELRMTLSS